jgi:FixJ family two-component response regulator
MSKDQLISIVDDDASVRDAIGNLVDSLGYNSATFASAKHFLEAGRIAETTCLIADLQMPGLSGLGLVSHTGNSDYRLPERQTPRPRARKWSGRLPNQTVRRKIAD